MSTFPVLLPAKRQSQSGFSLIELMISIVVGLVLVVIILQIFLGSKTTYRMSENNSRIQENGRYIIQEMSRDIRMAGYLGCSKNARINMMVKSTAGSWAQYNEPIRGYETASASMGLEATEVLSGTDIVRVQRASSSGAMTGNLETDNANVKIDSNPDGYAKNDTLVVSDCANADIFCVNNVSVGGGQVTISHSGPCNDGSPPHLSKLYGSNAEIFRLSTNIYYIGTGTGGCPAYMLCRKTLKAGALVVEELIDNVETMQLEYGEDTDGDATANRFVSAPSVTDWNSIVSVRMRLVLLSNDGNLSASPNPADRKLRKEFFSTVTLRNRTL